MIPHSRQHYNFKITTTTNNSNNNNINNSITQNNQTSSSVSLNRQPIFKDFESEFPSLQQTYKKHYLNKQSNNSNNYNNGSNDDNLLNSSNTTVSSGSNISEKDIELLKVFRNEINNNDENDCWKKRDLLYYVFIQKPHEITRIASFIGSVANYYELPSRNHLLDIGCGLGRMFEMWDRSKWQHIDAFEPDRDYFQFSLNHAHNLTNDKVQVYNAGFFELSQVYNKYDMVVSIHGPLQYLIKLDERILALRNIYNSLLDGGVVLLDVSNFLDALRNLRPQIEQKMLVNGVPVKRISNITVDTFNSIWSVEDIFYSNSGIKNNHNNNNNSNHNNNNNNNDSYDDKYNEHFDNEYDNDDDNDNDNNNNNNDNNSFKEEFLNELEYADGGIVVEQLQFSILSVNELRLLLLSTGFTNVRVVSSWGDSIFDIKDDFASNNHGPRIIITGQKPKRFLDQ